MRAMVCAVLLAGCAAPALRDLPLRNPTAPIASQVDVTAERLSGDWVVVQAAGMAPGSRVKIAPQSFVMNGKDLVFGADGQGRFRIGDDAVWVFWMDADSRTAALGDPEGRRVWIMDRSGRPGERLQAARQILDWYGYDLTRLEGA